MDTLENENRALINAYIIVKSAEVVGFCWMAATYVLFLLSKGLTPEQTTQVNFVFMTMNFVCDLPTGALADITGQIPVYLIGTLITGLGLTMYGFGANFWFFATCEGLSAIGTALMSESLEALITNVLGIDLAKQVMAKQGLYARLAGIPAAILGGWIGEKFGLGIPMTLAGITMLFGFVYGAITLRKYHVKPDLNISLPMEHLKQVGTQIKRGTKLIFATKQARLVLCVWAIFAIAMQTINMFWAPVFQSQGITTKWLGFIFVGISIATGIGSHLAKKISATPRNFGWTLISIGTPLIIIAMLHQNIWLTLGLFLAHEIGRGVLPILLYAYLNKYVPDEHRSAANSARSSMEQLFRALGLLGFGIMTNYTSILNTWLIAGLGLVVFGVVIATLKGKWH